MEFSIAGLPSITVLPCLASLVGFTVGAMLSSRLESMARVRGRPWFVDALVGEALVLAIAALVAWGFERSGEALTGRHYLVAALVALAMGVRNVTTLRANVPGMPTTVTTRAFTALIGGSLLALDDRIAPGGRNQIRRAGSVTAMFAGGLLAAWMIQDERLGPGPVLLATGAVVLMTAFGFLLVPHEEGAERV
jgi:hypothetical protein